MTEAEQRDQRTAYEIATCFAKHITYPVNADMFIQRLKEAITAARREQAESDAKLIEQHDCSRNMTGNPLHWNGNAIAAKIRESVRS